MRTARYAPGGNESFKGMLKIVGKVVVGYYCKRLKPINLKSFRVRTLE